jgi:hypothetical protein
MAFHVHSCGGDLRSSCCGLSYSIRAIQELLVVSMGHNHIVSIFLTLIESTSAEVQAKIWLGANNFTPLHELIGAEFIRFGAYPG